MGFSIPPWAVVVLAGTVLSAIVTVMVRAVLRASALDAQWQVLSGSIVKVKVQFAQGGSVTPQFTRAVDLAVEALILYGPWPRGALVSVIDGTRILVQAAESWPSSEGNNVGGQTSVDAKMISVGPSFGALCHELAHIAQWGINHVVDYQHTSWFTNGVWKADAEYRKQL